MKIFSLLIIILISFNITFGQKDYKVLDSISIRGQIFSALVQDGDTLILARLDDVSFTTLRSFKSRDEYKRYLKYKKYAAFVYPYARDAIKILQKIEDVTKDMRKSKRKKYIKRTYKQLEHNFKKQLIKLSKTQGRIMVKMIEKEMDESFYNIIKSKRNGFTAFYWHQFGKIYDYNLKRGYVKGDDLIMDAVLKDFDISYKENMGAKIMNK